MASTFRIALANSRFPESPAESVELARQAVAEASVAGAGIVCFPECFVPGYRRVGGALPPPNAGFLEGAWSAVQAHILREQDMCSRTGRPVDRSAGLTGPMTIGVLLSAAGFC
jgi:predicted amidohydrolase